jgi:hypothetical protein
MEATMADASTAVYSVLVIIILAFVVGRIGVGAYVRRSGGTERFVELASSLTTLVILVGGVLLYVRA